MIAWLGYPAQGWLVGAATAQQWREGAQAALGQSRPGAKNSPCCSAAGSGGVIMRDSRAGTSVVGPRMPFTSNTRPCVWCWCGVCGGRGGSVQGGLQTSWKAACLAWPEELRSAQQASGRQCICAWVATAGRNVALVVVAHDPPYTKHVLRVCPLTCSGARWISGGVSRGMRPQVRRLNRR